MQTNRTFKYGSVGALTRIRGSSIQTKCKPFGQNQTVKMLKLQGYKFSKYKKSPSSAMCTISSLAFICMSTCSSFRGSLPCSMITMLPFCPDHSTHSLRPCLFYFLPSSAYKGDAGGSFCTSLSMAPSFLSH